jgi:multidrug resistance efflux pump
MKSRSFILLFLTLGLGASPIQIEYATTRNFGLPIDTNAKIVQLSDQTQQIVSRLGGHLERYYVKPGQTVRKGDPVATLKSLELSRMSAHYLALEKELAAARRKLATVRRLHAKGLASDRELDDARMAVASVEARRATLATQLRSLGIEPATLKKPTDILTVRAHAPGVVSRLIVPLHTNVGSETPLATLVQKRGYYASAYLSPEKALALTPTVRATLDFAGKTFTCRYLSLLPSVDPATQRAQALFAIENPNDAKLLLEAFAPIRIETPPYRKLTAVRTSGLTLWNSEWVLFVPGPEEKAHEHGHEEGEKHRHEEAHEDEEESEHHEETPAFEPRAVRIVARFGEYAGVEGIEPGEAYVAEGVWYVKSLLLKSRMGHGHGH